MCVAECVLLLLRWTRGTIIYSSSDICLPNPIPISPILASRKAYDAAHYGDNGSTSSEKIVNKNSLRDKNEGIFDGISPVDTRRTSNSQDSEEDADSAFRAAMQRGSAKVKDGARFRASLQRINRTRLDVPVVGSLSPKVLLPVVAGVIWLVNYVLFMR